ncbi:MAG: STAS domain-containing protein [Bacteroidetes bacterium]|nr:STAS domain-containing protein [Bacteroidota bacterium]
MELTEKRNEDYVVLGINGRLDTTNYTILEKKLVGMIEAGTLKIIVNCSGMDYVSSSGLRVLLMALKMISRENGKFILCTLKENIREIFEISGFTSIFTICSTEDEALKAL